jgi:hypothetical protein
LFSHQNFNFSEGILNLQIWINKKLGFGFCLKNFKVKKKLQFKRGRSPNWHHEKKVKKPTFATNVKATSDRGKKSSLGPSQPDFGPIPFPPSVDASPDLKSEFRFQFFNHL